MDKEVEMESSWVDIDDAKLKIIFDNEGFEMHNLPIHIINDIEFAKFINGIHNEIFDKIDELKISDI